MNKETAFIICPGRGSYQADELGYLKKHHQDKTEFFAMLDGIRNERNQKPITTLDCAKRFTLSGHTNGENASLLIYACALADFMTINRDRYDIVAVAGNSMGWYLSLACAGALSIENGARLVNTMGTLMHQKGVGGQIIYPLVDERWQPDTKKIIVIENTILKAHELGYHVSISIRLGGMAVLAADKEGMAFLKKELPALERYPMELSFHAAFHSSLLNFIIPQAQSILPQSLLGQPAIPMIDGCGHIWSPEACNIQSLYRYTLGTQINETYDFTRSVEVGLKEFAPDKIIVLGPGTTMGPPVAQTVIAHDWAGIKTKDGFKKRQSKDPFILSMGIDEQRKVVI